VHSKGESLIEIPHPAGAEVDGLQGVLLQDVPDAQVQEVNPGGVPLRQQKEPKAQEAQQALKIDCLETASSGGSKPLEDV